MKNEKVKVGISIGDIAGIGLEVIIKTFLDSGMLHSITPIVYGDSNLAKYYRKELGINDFSFNQIQNANQANPKRVNIVNITADRINLNFGKPTKDTGALALKSLEHATQDLASNKIDVLVTAPIDKHTIQSDGFTFPGHTEYLANLSSVDEALMLMIEDDLRIGVTTGHVPLDEVKSHLDEELILHKLEMMHASLKGDFGILQPKIAVLALNPHAGDQGLIGDEEQTIIGPAIEKANQKGIIAFGPYPADGFFGHRNYRNFDAILAMYHDQGLIPFKTLAESGGVNFTAGLPVVRTSPAHGTAYDIAGKNEADPASFRQAVFAACDIYIKRKQLKEWTANPLEKEEMPRKKST